MLHQTIHKSAFIISGTTKRSTKSVSFPLSHSEFSPSVQCFWGGNVWVKYMNDTWGSFPSEKPTKKRMRESRSPRWGVDIWDPGSNFGFVIVIVVHLPIPNVDLCSSHSGKIGGKKDFFFAKNCCSRPWTFDSNLNYREPKEKIIEPRNLTWKVAVSWVTYQN